MISVIVPVYNAKKFLDKCIDSILNQSYREFEILLVDDGSTDESSDICDGYSKHYEYIRTFHKKNGGAASARNLALDNVKGEYLIFVDADDYIPQNHLEVLYGAITKEAADVVIASVTYVPGPIVSHAYMTADKTELLSIMMYRNGIGDYPVSKLYKTELFNGLRYREGMAGEDFDIFFELFSRVQRAVITDETTYYYVQRNSSVSNKEFNTGVFGRIDTCRRLEESVKDTVLIDPMKACLVDESVNIYTITPHKYKAQLQWAKDTFQKNYLSVLADPCATKKLKNKIRLFKINPILWKLRMNLKHLYIMIKE